MIKPSNNNAFKYLLVLWLSISLVLAQSYGVHLHVEHDHHTASGHAVDLQTVSTLHLLDDSAHNSFAAHHHTIDLSPDSLVKTKTAGDLLLVAILILFAWAIVSPALQVFIRRSLHRPTLSTHYNLLHPPLRAPPVK